MNASQRSSADSFDAILERSNLTRRQLLILVGQDLSGVLLYDAVWAIDLTRIDPDSFDRAFQALVGSCDALRTVLEERDGVPFQRVLPELRYAIPRVDLRAVEHPRAAADAWIRQRCDVPFKKDERLFDTALLRTGDEAYSWFLNLHHVIADGWSAGVLVQLQFDLYARARRGDLPASIPLPSFHAYASLARERMRLPEYRAAEDYWRARFATPVDLPSFYGGAPAHRSTSKTRVSLELGVELTRKLKALAARDDVFVKSPDATMTNVLGALLFAYAYRASGTKRLAIGVAFHNRVEPEQKQLIGLLMEVLPYLVTVDPAESFLSLIERVNAEAQNAVRHRVYSVGNPLQAPAYDMFLNPIRSIEPGEGWEPARRIFPGYGETSLSLTALDASISDNLQLCFDVSSDLMNRVGGDVMASHFRTLVEAAVANPERAVASLPLASEAERERVMLWNRTHVAEPAVRLVHSMFETQVSRAPEAVAVICGTMSLTYRELDAQSNQLAHYLQKLGVVKETLVGICLPRGLDLIVALLGVLKAGAAYVPLDPAYPAERLAFMLEDTSAPLVLTNAGLREDLARPGLRAVCLDAERALIAEESQERPDSDTDGTNLAYVMYTSGSTGRPKGAMVAHRGVSNYLRWRRGYFPLVETDALLQTSSVSFDDSVWEIFEPLSAGARLVLVDAGREQDLPHLVGLIARHRISAVCFVPSILHAFLDVLDAEAGRHLRRVTTGGETLSAELAERFFARLPAARLYNGYGPTEATVSATFWECRPGGPSPVPIGRPIANVQIYVLDHDGQMAPIGVPGELLIGGVGVARGYVNQPQMTADRFVPDRFSGETDSGLYRTGDVGRWLADGNLEFLGRLDHQVKLRGFRIELGEIEAALRRHPEVRDAAVTLRDDVPFGRQLVAYVAIGSAVACTSNDLRAFVARILPRHMVPAVFVTLDRLPLGPGGKVDRAALPAPGQDRPELDQAFAAPRTATEKKLATIWSEVLKLDRIGIHDDFFQLGGHSILAVRLFARIKEAFGRELPLSTLLDGATIGDLAELLRPERPPSSHDRIVAIQPHGSRTPLLFLPSITGDLLLWRELSRALGDDQPCFGWQLVHDDEFPDACRLSAIAGRCLSDLQRAALRGPYALVGFSFGGTLAFEIAQQLVAGGERVSLLAIGDTGLGRARPGSVGEWRPAIVRFLTNAGWWMRDDLLRTSPIEVGQRARRAVRSILRRVAEASNAARAGDVHPEDIWEMTDVSEATRRLIEAHLRALADYEPRPYPGRITVFRARAQPLFNPGADDLGWSAIAEGGVNVDVIPGSHDTILRLPNVRLLAELLKVRMDQSAAV